MKIALIGYGKMGKIIETIAQARSHEIVLRISIENTQDFTTSALQQADVAIEFTGPESAYENIKQCLHAGVPVVSGSTGWLHQLDDIKNLATQKKAAFLYASNFSIGVNLFFELHTYLAGLMAPYKAYQPLITEVHHTEKKDAPSGTAITLAEQLIEKYPAITSWVNDETAAQNQLSIISERKPDVPGTHSIKYSSAEDEIEIIHTAHNRKGFAEGAVLAAEYIAGRQGIFTMQDVLFKH